tara:strand:+ start:1022 stop:1687 length:666 start_codon:yes stop_codon:yes gene_type:complete
MSEELSPQVLARKQRFIEDKEAAGSFEALMDQQDVIHRSKRVFFDERGDIVSVTFESPAEVNPLWLTYEFTYSEVATLEDKDTNKFWVVQRKDGTCELQLRPQATVYAKMKEDDVVKIEFSPTEKTADCMISIKEDHAIIELSDEYKETMKGVYPIQATIKGKRIFKFHVCDPDQQGVIFDTVTVSMVELLTEKFVQKELLADLRHCIVYTTPLFDKYLRT